MSEFKKTLDVTLTNNSNITNKKTSFKITLDTSIPTQKSWSGKEVLEKIGFKITEITGDKLKYLRVKESSGRKITFNGETTSDWVDLLEDNNEIKDYGFIEVLRNSEEDYGEVKLSFCYEWKTILAKTYESEILIGDLSFLNQRYTSIDEWPNEYNKDGNICYYTYDSITKPVLFFDERLTVKHLFYLTKEQFEWSPKEVFEKEIRITSLYDTSKNTEIKYKLENYELEISDTHTLIYNIEIGIENFTSIYEKTENEIIEIIPVFTTIKDKETILLPFSKKPNLVWTASSYYPSVQCDIYFSRLDGCRYNCEGDLNFFRDNQGELEEISLIEFFFKGLGFYYNFEKGITQNQFYINKPYWFYLFESSSLSLEERNELINSFLYREKMSGEEGEKNEKEGSFYGTSEIYKVSLFKTLTNLEVPITNPYLQITIVGEMKQNIEEEIIWKDHFYKENENGEQGSEEEGNYDPGHISLYDSQTVILWFKEEESCSYRQSLFNKRNQGFQWGVLNPSLGTLWKYIDEVAILPEPVKLTPTNGYEISSTWKQSLIVSDYKIEFIERDSITKELINEFLLKTEEDNIEKEIAFIQDKDIILSNFSPNNNKIYSLRFSMTLENLENSETRSVECCQWVPFYTTFSTTPINFSYEPVWVQKTVTSTTNFYEKGLYRITEEGEIRRTLHNFSSLSEGSTYYECEDQYGNKSPYYISSASNINNQKFYGNEVNIPIFCTSELNWFFSLRGKDGIFNFNKLLNFLKEYQNTNIINFPAPSTKLIQYKQAGGSNDWNNSSAVFSEDEAHGAIYFKNLTYTFPEEITEQEEFKQTLIMSAFLTCPLSKLELSNISPYYPIYFRSNVGEFNIEWSYPALGKNPTIAYRKNRIGINTIRVDDLLTDVIVIQQLEDQKSRYITFYNLNGEITFQVDLETGNFYTSGNQQETIMRVD